MAELDVDAILERLSPELIEPEYDARRRAWQDALFADGWRAQVFAHEFLEDAVLGNQVALPPVLSVGELRVEPEQLDRWQRPVAKKWLVEYLHRHSYPALVSWRDATAISFRAVGAPQADTALMLAQRTLVSVLASLRADLVRVIAIDTLGFGRRAALLSAAVPRLDLVTSQDDVVSKLRALQTSLRDNLAALGLRDASLSAFNQRNPDAARPFTFVFVASAGTDLQRESQEIVRRMVHEEIGVRGGIQFILVDDGTDSSAEAGYLTANSPRVLVMGPDKKVARTRLEVVDVSGLDTRPGCAHDPFEVVAALEVEELERVADTCRRHLDAGRPPNITLPLPDASARWTGDASGGISVPIGRSGDRTIRLSLGEGGLTFNALVGGAVGTGKTVLLHGIICHAAATYGPDELQLSLLDYKEGTEFSIYRDLPHIYALSLGPSSDFGYEVIRSFQKEMSRRASLYKQAGVRDLPSYRRVTGTKLPRHLVVIDEFQVLLANRADARDVLEDLIRRGRSAGIHLIPASQSLADMSLNTAVLGQLGGRICLKLSASESSRFLSVGNESPSRLQHPGQAIFNEREGALDGNVEFRAANYDMAEIRGVVADLASRAPRRSDPLGPPFIYDADAPATLSAEERTAIVPARHVLWGLSQELPPQPVLSSIDQRGIVSIIDHGQKAQVLVQTLRIAASAAGLGVAELTSAEVVAAVASGVSAPAGPVVVTVGESGFATEDAIKALRDASSFLVVVVAADARTLAAAWFRDDVISCDEASMNEIAYRRMPALRHEALVARVVAGGEPIVARVVAE